MELKYGQTRIPFEFKTHPDVYLTKNPEKTITSKGFQQAFDNALSQEKPDLSKPAIIVGDKTRLCGYPDYLPIVLNSLQVAGAKKEDIKIFIAYGTHPPQSREESLVAYGPLFEEYQFIHHDCADNEQFIELGVTRKGTQVLVRKDLQSASFILTFGAISHHYFAGYGGGRKLIFPGLGHKPAIYQNHSLFLDGQQNCLAKGCQPGKLEGNPLAEDLQEAESFFSADLSIHGILNDKGEVCDLLVGKGMDFFKEACACHGGYCEISAQQQYDVVIASCGGFPKDINFIQSHKAVHNAAKFVRDGGHLIVLAECRDGVGSKTFLPWLEMGGYEKAFSVLSENYEGNGGTALAMMEKTQRIRISMVTSIDENTSQTIGFERLTIDQAQSIMAEEQSQIAVIPNASLLVKAETNGLQ